MTVSPTAMAAAVDVHRELARIVLAAVATEAVTASTRPAAAAPVAAAVDVPRDLAGLVSRGNAVAAVTNGKGCDRRGSSGGPAITATRPGEPVGRCWNGHRRVEAGWMGGCGDLQQKTEDEPNQAAAAGHTTFGPGSRHATEFAELVHTTQLAAWLVARRVVAGHPGRHQGLLRLQRQPSARHPAGGVRWLVAFEARR